MHMCVRMHAYIHTLGGGGGGGEGEGEGEGGREIIIVIICFADSGG